MSVPEISPNGHRNRRKQLSASIAAGETGPVITLSGEADLTAEAELSTLVTVQLAGGTKFLTIDVSRLTFADMASLRVLVRAARTLRRRGGGLVLLRPHAGIVKMLHIADKDQVITVAGHCGGGTAQRCVKPRAQRPPRGWHPHAAPLPRPPRTIPANQD